MLKDKSDPKISEQFQKLKGKKGKQKKLKQEPEGTKSQKLPKKLEETLKSEFSDDFSKMRVHTGGNSAELAKSLGAKAFAQGANIYLAKPSDGGNIKFLAHEAWHVVQQNQGKCPKVVKKGKAITSK